MTYVLCKHKKTGAERKFTEPVFRANEHQYKFIKYVDNPNAEKSAETTTEKPVKATSPKPEVNKQGPSGAVDTVLDDLRVQYKALTGKDPKKTWGVPKLTEEIKKAEQPTV